ncbi:HAD domain-containing protein [Bacillus cereus]|uniref:HAD domain-containing protein n=1 Tax=Bacillus cereus TaxID=1396 RepID=UPI002405C7A7|nr:HAD domain-containing protein [Bacillus cereus]MCU5279466.1 HAD domain-containing protein [Bacillus cereus]MDF9598963.1 HAD domain-containing protein [Bacillus cereus]MDG1589296.1 HAD domain-containing protein [Bacillus cereus]
MNLIFLDIDGVMNHSNYFVRSKQHMLQAFCPKALINLKEILEKCNAKIVVTSTWRKLGSANTLKKSIFSHYGLQKYVIGRTPILINEPRGAEIQAFIDNFNKPIDRFIIIDDDDDMLHLSDRLVLTSPYKDGLNERKRDEAIQLLNQDTSIML